MSLDDQIRHIITKLRISILYFLFVCDSHLFFVMPVAGIVEESPHKHNNHNNSHVNTLANYSPLLQAKAQLPTSTLPIWLKVNTLIPIHVLTQSAVPI